MAVQKSSAPVALAIIGCGAITEQSYLPALRKMAEFNVASLIDTNAERARALAHQYQIAHYAATTSALPQDVEAAVIALQLSASSSFMRADEAGAPCLLREADGHHGG